MLTSIFLKRFCAAAAAATVLLIAGCGGSTDYPDVSSAQLNDKGPIFRSLSITLSEPGGVDVEYWSSSSGRLRMASTLSNATVHEVALPRLRANSTYSYEIRSKVGAKRGPVMSAGSFQTADLPTDLKAMTFTPTGAASQPLMFLSARSTFTGGVIIDAEGQIVWYARTSIAPQGATLRANGNWVIELNNVGLAEFSSLGEQVGFLPQSRLPAGTQIHHSVTATPQNTLLFFAYEPRVFGAQTLQGEAIWAWDPQADTVTRRWTSFDFLDPAIDFGPRSIPGDWFHANSIAIGQHGNIVLSFHFLDQVLSLAPDFSSIEWRLGGPGSTYPISAAQATSGQHSAREVAPNDILIFDNGYARADGSQYTRGLELRLDPVTHTVSTVWQYRPNPDIWTTVISSIRRLANGNSVLTFGTSAGIAGATGPLAIHEVSPTGALVWQVAITFPPGGSIFQGDPIASIGGETAVP
ncbi:MAG: aryl-sulfate sulfotransferase [Burkholderiales bacterium]|nr:aryl-sulfate sulfotransferase [Burkholderiales bacterium]